jgi:DNA-binding HxlR family transcriptional regulator
LLLIRDLCVGPRRFSELTGTLKGIPHDVLAQRLQILTAAELITTAGPGRYDGYRLTEDGKGLLPVLRHLAGWGTPRLPPTPPDARLALTGLVISLDPMELQNVDVVVHFVVEEEEATLRLKNGSYSTSSESPDVVLVTTPACIAPLIKDRTVRLPVGTEVSGDPALVDVVLRALHLPTERSTPSNLDPA